MNYNTYLSRIKISCWRNETHEQCSSSLSLKNGKLLLGIEKTSSTDCAPSSFSEIEQFSHCWEIPFDGRRAIRRGNSIKLHLFLDIFSLSPKAERKKSISKRKILLRHCWNLLCVKESKKQIICKKFRQNFISQEKFSSFSCSLVSSSFSVFFPSNGLSLRSKLNFTRLENQYHVGSIKREWAEQLR